MFWLGRTVHLCWDNDNRRVCFDKLRTAVAQCYDELVILEPGKIFSQNSLQRRVFVVCWEFFNSPPAGFSRHVFCYVCLRFVYCPMFLIALSFSSFWSCLIGSLFAGTTSPMSRRIIRLLSGHPKTFPWPIPLF